LAPEEALMKLLVIGSGMMGSAAAYDMARAPEVEFVTLADTDLGRAKESAARVNKLTRFRKVRAVKAEATNQRAAAKLMKGHDAALSAVPYFLNLTLAKAAIDAGCHFADLGGNNTVVREELALDKKARKANVSIAPDCGLSPGLASILAGELMRRIGGKADQLAIYVGAVPENPVGPFKYRLLFSVEGLINEYVEPVRILRKGKLTTIEPLSELETFIMSGMPPLEAFHTSGGTSTLPETFQGKVGECFEKSLRYPGHYAMARALYDLGFFSAEERRVGKVKIAPRALTSQLMSEKFAGNAPDITVLRVEAHHNNHVAAFTIVDRYDPKTKMTSMMRTTAWPASIVVQMMASGSISKRGAVLQELDVPADEFLQEMEKRGIEIAYSLEADFEILESTSMIAKA
jgi:lysine 6-dehydrogenase